MPCFSERSHDNHMGFARGRKEISDEMIKKVVAKQAEVDRLEAALCAVLTELSQREIFTSVITTASRHGLIDLVTWWEHHKQDDKSRLTSVLHKYSIDEQKVMFKILGEQL
jgi:hypothetical protein